LILPLGLLQSDLDEPVAGFGASWHKVYRALTMLAQHHIMKIRDNISAVIEGLQKEHGLLAAYLEATDKIDWRALNKRVVIVETPKPVNVEVHHAATAPQLPEIVPSTPIAASASIVPSTSRFVFRRANLGRSP
jgi:hypothetical protein